MLRGSRSDTRNPRPVRTCLSATLLACGALGLVACGGGGGGGSASKTSNHVPGTVVDKPGGGFCFADPNQNGNAQDPRIAGVAFGRLVEVFGLDGGGARVLMASSFVVGHEVETDYQKFLLESNPVTARDVLVVLRDVTDTEPGGGRAEFFELLFEASEKLTPVFVNDSQSAGVYSMIPRNATVVIRFDDLVDVRTLDATTVRVRTGDPPVLPFEARLVVDPNHGDLSDHDGEEGSEFYSTRVLVDPTVSEIESFTTEPPLPVNGIGLPPSVDVSLANFELRIPTKLDNAMGQIELLRNPSGHSVTAKNNGPVDHGSPTKDVVRAARSGGAWNVTGDPHNGFLRDVSRPQVIGVQPLQIISNPIATANAAEFLLPLVVFESEVCSQTPDVGDLLFQDGVFAEIAARPAPVQQGKLTDVLVRVILYPRDWDNGAGAAEWVHHGHGDAEFRAAFDPVDDAGRQACFVRITPHPAGYPEEPATGLAPASVLGLRFSEPMDPLSVTAFDSMALTREPAPGDEDPPLSTSSYVVGTVVQALDLQDFAFVPDLPLAHRVGVAEPYWLRLEPGDRGPTDLAGNGLELELPQIEVTIYPGAPSQRNGGRVSRFRGADEEPPFGSPETGPIPEWFGQHAYNLDRELIAPRPVTRFRGIADRTRPIVKQMIKFGAGVQTPLSSLGSKMQALWRYVDFGWDLTDTARHNIELEGLYWSPAQGQVIWDSYTYFEMRTAHSLYAHDEWATGAGVLKYPESGLVKEFANNFLDTAIDPPKVLHPKELGYMVNPGDLTIASTGTPLMPYPLNRTVPPDEWRTWAWRDTSIRTRGGPENDGVPPRQEYKALGVPRPSNPYFKVGEVQTVGLPMLFEIRCYPDDGAVGMNPFDVSYASNFNPAPGFRVFSTGGINKNGKVKRVNPDLQKKANGGYDPNSSPPGKKTPGLDNTFYVGAADFVVRVSRSHSIWFAAVDPLEGGPFAAPTYIPPRVEPAAEDQPDGTSATLSFRGVTSFDPATDKCTGDLVWDPLENAMTIDLYGDHYNDKCIPKAKGQPNHSLKKANIGLEFPGDDSSWHDDIAAIDGAAYYQVRVTFEANTLSGVVPELSAVAVAWTE